MANPYRVAAPKPLPDLEIPKEVLKIRRVPQPKILWWVPCYRCFLMHGQEHMMWNNIKWAKYICERCFGQVTHMEYQEINYYLSYGCLDKAYDVFFQL